MQNQAMSVAIAAMINEYNTHFQLSRVPSGWPDDIFWTKVGWTI